MLDRKEPRDITAEEAAALSYSQGLKIANEPGSKKCMFSTFVKPPEPTEHTPGPWLFNDDGWIDGALTATTDERGNWKGLVPVMDYEGCGTHKAYIENPYDMALIKHAPDVLAALVKAKALIDILMPGVKHLFDVDFESLNMTCIAVNEAIAKATTKEE